MIKTNDQPITDPFKQKLRILVSYCATALCCYASYLIMEYYYSWEKYAYAEYGINSYTAMLPGIVYTVIVIITSQKYRQFARKLTNFENHRTESSFQKNLLVKLLVFEFINNFLVLYLLAFIYEDLEMLRSTVITTMTISQVFVEIFEGVVPFAFYKSRTKEWPNRYLFWKLNLNSQYFSKNKVTENISQKRTRRKASQICRNKLITRKTGMSTKGISTSTLRSGSSSDTSFSSLLFTSTRRSSRSSLRLLKLEMTRTSFWIYSRGLNRESPVSKFRLTFQGARKLEFQELVILTFPILESIGFWDDAFSLLAFLAIPTQIGLGKMLGLTTWKKAAIAEHLVIFLAVAVNRLRPCPAETQKQIDRDEYFRTHRHESNLLKKVQENKHD